MTDELAQWAASVGRAAGGATFGPLAEALTQRLAKQAVETLFEAADLDPSHKADALADLMIEQATTGEGGSLLRFGGWYGCTTEVEWDGSDGDARDCIVSYALGRADDIEGDRMPYGPHVWDWPEGPPKPDR